MTTRVTKIDGTTEVYSEEKIKASATRAGVPSEMHQAMLEAIRERLYDGIQTTEIYALVKEYLSNTDKPYLAMKYNLKRALSELGPSGYPFEKYVAMLLSAIGYQTITNQVISGECVTHEVDVVADLEGVRYFVEAKFHKSPTQRTDVRVPLYIKARYDDLAKAHPDQKTAAWLITNTRFSTDAIKYAECQGIKLTSWGYPKNEGIMDLIERTKLHPVTMVDGLSDQDKMRLMSAGVVTCQQLLDPKNKELLPKEFIDMKMPQIEALCRAD